MIQLAYILKRKLETHVGNIRVVAAGGASQHAGAEPTSPPPPPLAPWAGGLIVGWSFPE